MSFEDFFQAEILLWSGVEWSGAGLSLAKLHSFPHVLTNVQMGDSRDSNYHLIGVLSPLSLLETPVSLAADCSKYPRIVAGGTSN